MRRDKESSETIAGAEKRGEGYFESLRSFPKPKKKRLDRKGCNQIDRGPIRLLKEFNDPLLPCDIAMTRLSEGA